MQQIFKPNEIIVLNDLITQTETVGKFVEMNENYVIIETPIRLVFQQDPASKKASMALTNIGFTVVDEGKFFFRLGDRQLLAKANDEISKKYRESTSGIILPTGLSI